MPQWDFLDFLAEAAQRFAGFHLLMQTEGQALIERAGRITGVQAKTQNGALEIKAELVVGADGRHSVVRASAGLPVETFGVLMDVLWLRLSRAPTIRRNVRPDRRRYVAVLLIVATTGSAPA